MSAYDKNRTVLSMDEVWNAVKDLPEITSRDLARIFAMSPDIGRKWLARMADRNMIRRLPRGGRRNVFAPGSNADAQKAARADILEDLGDDPQRNMWRAMKVLKQFTPMDIVAVTNGQKTPVTERDAQAFCQLLLKGEYVRVLEEAIPGERPAAYHLARWTGPLPPRERRVKAIWDENQNGLTYVAGIGVTS